ncbi:MAG: putative DNA binding domain-containing protein [Thermodesulfobacteriota bacterium]|nr:putative DNA binding domain-containing protein [Thermodesulfobacteriota bacterium]
MDIAQAREIIAKGEDKTVEFKLRLPNPYRLAKKIASFANTDGGLIIAGVDDGANIVGVESVRRSLAGFRSANRIIEPVPRIDVSSLKIDNVMIAVCRVFKGDNKPYKVVSDRGRSYTYVRVGSRIMPVSNRDSSKLEDEDILKKKLRIGPLQKAFLDETERTKGITIKQLALKHNISVRRTIRLVTPLVKAGLLRQQDTSMGVTYIRG